MIRSSADRISLAEKTLGWSPSTKLRDGLIKTVEYFKTII